MILEKILVYSENIPFTNIIRALFISLLFIHIMT